jgi:hypothetical protein
MLWAGSVSQRGLEGNAVVGRGGEALSQYRSDEPASASGCTSVYVKSVNKLTPVIFYLFTVVTFKGVGDRLCCLTALYQLQLMR